MSLAPWSCSVRPALSREAPSPRRLLDLRPETHYESIGDVHDVVFPCGYKLDSDGDTVNLYYGGPIRALRWPKEACELCSPGWRQMEELRDAGNDALVDSDLVVVLPTVHAQWNEAPRNFRNARLESEGRKGGSVPRVSGDEQREDLFWS
jgi:hypothetical protein